MKQQAKKLHIRFIAIAIASVLAFGACTTSSDASLEPVPDPQRVLAEEHEEYALNHTKRIVDAAQSDSPVPRELASSSRQECWLFFREQFQNSTVPYSLTIITNAQDTPYPFRDVMDIRVGVNFPDGRQAEIWWYAGGVATCSVYETAIPGN
jgi:hypothetical protein